MRTRRAAALAGAAAVAAAAPVAGAEPQRPWAPPTPASVTGERVVVHYDPQARYLRLNEGGARYLGSVADAALATVLRELAMPMPVDDGDGRVDLYVAHDAQHHARAIADQPGDGASGALLVRPGAAYRRAALLFRLARFGIVAEDDGWLAGSTAAWAAAAAEGRAQAWPLWQSSP